MKPGTWIAVAKRSSALGALLLLPLGHARADGPAPAQPTAATAPKPAKPVVPPKPAVPPKPQPAAHGGGAHAPGPAPAPATDTPVKAAAKAQKKKPAAAEPAAAAHADKAPPSQPERAQIAPAPQPALRLTGDAPPQPSAANAQPSCSLAEPEQPRGGRLDVLGERIGSAPVVRIAGKPARMLERRADRISVQIPADSDGGPITLQNDGKALACGTLVIIGKNR